MIDWRFSFGNRLISQNVYASYDPSKTYINADILKFEKVWLEDQEENRPNDIKFTVKLAKHDNKPDEIKEIVLDKNNGWKSEIICNKTDSNQYAGYWPDTIKEIVVDGYEYMGESEPIISYEGQTKIVTITLANKKLPTGNLIVSKDVNGNKGDTNKDFHFTVTLSDTSINGTYGDMTFKDGVATFTLKDNESLTATSLPTGISYKVTEQEANQDGYVTTSTNDKGYILNNQNIKVDFINTKEVEPQSSNQTPLKNDHQSQPQTDDDSALMVYMSLGIMSGLSALGLILLKKKA